MAIYMKADGITGNVTAKGFEGQVELLSAHVAFHRNVRMVVGNASNMESSRPEFDQVAISKKSCAASPLLITKLLAGKSIPELVISYCHTNKDLTAYKIITLNDAMVSGIESPDHSTDEGVEDYTLSYSKIEYKYIPRDKTGNTTTPVSVCYDLAEATVE